MGYADDHSLLKIIPNKTDQTAAASALNCDLAALYHFGLTWKIKFPPNKTCSLLISLKHDLQSSPHPPLFLNNSNISETSTAQILGFIFDSLLTWEPHIVRMLNHEKQRVSQLYRCRSVLTSQDLCLMYTSWIRPTLEYGNILYCGAALSHLQCLDNLQTRTEHTCCSTFQSLLHRLNAAITGFVCRLLAGEGRKNLQTFCPTFHGTDDICRQSSRLHSWDPADHLCFIDPCNFRTLDRFRRSWQISAVHLWNALPADILLSGDTDG